MSSGRGSFSRDSCWFWWPRGVHLTRASCWSPVAAGSLALASHSQLPTTTHNQQSRHTIPYYHSHHYHNHNTHHHLCFKSPCLTSVGRTGTFTTTVIIHTYNLQLPLHYFPTHHFPTIYHYHLPLPPTSQHTTFPPSTTATYPYHYLSHTTLLTPTLHNTTFPHPPPHPARSSALGTVPSFFLFLLATALALLCYPLLLPYSTQHHTTSPPPPLYSNYGGNKSGRGG